MRKPATAAGFTRALFMFVAFVLAFAVGCARAPVRSPAVSGHWPTARWDTASPESQGIDSGVLIELLDFAVRKDVGVHDILIVRHGVLVFDAVFYPYDGEIPHDVASVTKSVTTTLLGAAIHGGKLDRLDRSIAALLHRQRPSMNRVTREITLEHLASMRSGLACGLSSPGEPELIAMMQRPDWVDFTLDLPMSHAPGRRFAYCSPGMHLLSAAITELTDKSEADFAAAAIFAPMGIAAWDWPSDPAGLSHGWGDLRLRPRDMAKIGLLMLHDGVWDGRRLLPAGWAATAARSRGRTSVGGDGYGLGWWIPSRELHGVFEARGRGGQRIVIWPALDLVVVTTGAGFEPGLIVPFLSRAIRGAKALPENQVLFRRLEEALVAARCQPKAVPAALPELAGQVSGRTYEMEANPLGFERVNFDFHAAEPTLSLELSGAMGDGTAGRFRFMLGFDGRYRITPAGPRGYAVAIRAAWHGPNRIDIDYVEPYGPNAFVLRVAFEDDRIRLSIRDRTGLYGEHLIAGRVRRK